MTDYVSVHRFAEMFDVSVKTARRWIDEHPDIFSGRMVRRMRTLFLSRQALDEWEELFGRSTDLITSCEAGRVLGISVTTLKRRLKSDPGFPKPRRVGRIVRFDRSEIQEYKERTWVDDE